MFKTLVAEVDGALTVAIVPVAAKLDLKALAAAVGGKRAKMAEVAAAERATGYVAGGISPLGQRKRLPTVLDASAEAFDTMFCSAGRRGLEIELAPADLVRLTGAKVAPVSAVTIPSQAVTAARSPGASDLRLWSPRSSTTARPGAASGRPNGSRSPCTTSTGTVGAASSARRSFSGLPGGCTGNARQSTPTAPPAVAVRQATRAPELRPPNSSGELAAQVVDDRQPRRVELRAGAGARRPATR